MTGGPLFISSGNRIADQRYESALDRAARGDLAGAADVLAQVVALAPAFATAWFALGAIRDNLGDHAGALAAWRNACAADPEDYHGARLQLARLGVGEEMPAMTAAYVCRLFDQHAASFDELTERLDYRGPSILLEAVQSVARLQPRIGSTLDLGCGTGLGGASFRPHADWLVGVDLSPAMIANARAKGIYDRLAVRDLQHFLHAEADAHARYHLILAADVFMYVGDLAPVTAAVAHVLTPEGLFAFTVETHPGDGVVLQPTLRYAHGAGYVRTVIADAGLHLLRLNHARTRTEKGVPVEGLVAVVSKRAWTEPALPVASEP